MKTLVIVESPAKCKTIQKYLGANYVVIACYGHCVDLAKGGKFGIGIDINNNLKPHYVLQEDKMNHFDDIVNASIGCDNILLASDADREGEAISYHLKTRLASTGKPMKRISFIEITPAALQAALLNQTDIDMNLFKAQQARRILDRLVGFMVSPFLRNVYTENLSAGRVQSVAVRMIVDREAEIKAFVPKEFWTMFLDLSPDGTERLTVKYDGELKTKQESDTVVAAIQNGPFVVDSVIRKPKKEKAPPPLTTLVMQQIMSKKYGFSAEQTMSAAQTCYEAGYTTYIRTDSVRINDDFIKDIRTFIKGQGYVVTTKANVHESKDTSADSHEAIRCTNVNTLPANVMLTGDEKTLYEVIWRYTVASQMEPAVFDTLEVKVKCGKHVFRASGKALSVKGYLEVLGIGKDTKIDIPDLQVKSAVTLIGKDPIRCDQKFTQASARYTEANLIKDLDARQIGRSSTMATILKNIFARNYVVKNGNTYHPTDLGIKISNLLSKYFEFVNFNYSALMEANLDKIAAGTADYDTVMKQFYASFSQNLKEAITNNNCISCDRCNGIMVERENTRGKYLSCSGCRNFQSLEAA